MVVAIDGPAGTGKSSVSRRVAEKTGFFYLNSGKFYRAITYKALRSSVDMDDRDGLVAMARKIDITVRDDLFFVDTLPIDRELHTPEVDAFVARVSSIPELREEVNRRLKAVAQEKNVVTEGRDISTVVFPDAEVKIFLDADVHIRALRRWEESDRSVSLEEIKNSMVDRDEIDRTKSTGRLRLASDAVYLDTTHLTLEQVCEKVVATIQDTIKYSRST